MKLDACLLACPLGLGFGLRAYSYVRYGTYVYMVVVLTELFLFVRHFVFLGKRRWEKVVVVTFYCFERRKGQLIANSSRHLIRVL